MIGEYGNEPDSRDEFVELPSNLTETADGSAGRQMVNPAEIKAFLQAGRAIGTLVGNTNRYTFKVSAVEDRQHAGRYTLFVNLLTGPENTSDYTYLGILDRSTGLIKLTRASRLPADRGPVAAWNWFMARIWSGRMPTAGQFWHVGRCGRCGRVLTVPSSIAAGLGPECQGKVAL